MSYFWLPGFAAQPQIPNGRPRKPSASSPQWPSQVHHPSLTNVHNDEGNDIYDHNDGESDHSFDVPNNA